MICVFFMNPICKNLKYHYLFDVFRIVNFEGISIALSKFEGAEASVVARPKISDPEKARAPNGARVEVRMRCGEGRWRQVSQN